MATGTAYLKFTTAAEATICCKRCETPFALWDSLHPLFRSWSTKCPDCHTRDIQLDFAHQNQES